MLEAFLGGIIARGKASTNEKTMVDALTPAVAAAKQALSEDVPLAELTARTAAAAEEGMKATIPMLATKGRASYLGERSIGHQDPGSTSSWFILRSLAEVTSNEFKITHPWGPINRPVNICRYGDGHDKSAPTVEELGLYASRIGHRSHSAQLAAGVAELAGQMTQGKTPIAVAGGADGGILGTSVETILAAIQSVDEPDGVLVLLDLGSAILSTEMALEMLDDEQRKHIVLSSAPLVEGAIAAAVKFSLARTLHGGQTGS